MSTENDLEIYLYINGDEDGDGYDDETGYGGGNGSSKHEYEYPAGYWPPTPVGYGCGVEFGCGYGWSDCGGDGERGDYLTLTSGRGEEYGGVSGESGADCLGYYPRRGGGRDWVVMETDFMNE